MGDGRKEYGPSNPRLPIFYERFKKAVDEAGGVTAVSTLTGISRPTISFWYNGQRTPDAENLRIICKALDVSADYFLGLIDAKTRDKDVKFIHKFTGLSEAAIEALHGSFSEIACGVNQESIPVREREVVNALLESEAGRRALDYMYSFLFTSFDKFQMGEQERDYVTMIGDTLPAYTVRPEDVLEVFVLRMNQCLTELKKEVDGNGKH